MASSGAIRAGRAFVELFVNDNKLTRGLDAVKRRFLGFAGQMERVGATLGGAFRQAGAGILAPLSKAFSSAAENGTAIQNLADRTGESAEALARLAHGFAVAGGGVEDFEAAVDGLNAKVIEAAKSSGYLFEDMKRLGTGQQWLSLPVEERFRRIAEAMDSLPTADLRQAFLNELPAGFQKISQYLLRGSAGWREYQAEAAKGARSPDELRRAQQVTRGLTAVWADLKAAVLDVGFALLPTAGTIDDVRDKIRQTIGQARDWIKANRGVVLAAAAIGAGLVATGAAFTGLAVAAQVATAGVMVTVGALGLVKLSLAALLSPVGLVVGAFLLIGRIRDGQTGAWRAFADAGSGAFKTIGETFRTAWQGIIDALQTGDLKTAFEIVVLGLKAVWAEALAFMAAKWSAFKKTTVGSAIAEVARVANGGSLLNPQTRKQELDEVEREIARRERDIEGLTPGGRYAGTYADMVKKHGLEKVNQLRAEHEAALDQLEAKRDELRGGKPFDNTKLEEFDKTIANLEEIQRRHVKGFGKRNEDVDQQLAKIRAQRDRLVRRGGAAAAANQDPEVVAAEKEAKDARDRLKAAVDAAAKVREEARKKAEAEARAALPDGAPFAKMMAQLRAQGGGGRGLLPLAEQAHGVFSGPIAQQLAYGDTVPQQQLDQLKNIAGNAAHLPAIAAGIANIGQGMRVGR